MHSSFVSKIGKAKAYAEERDRMQITSLGGVFRGNHNTYHVTYDAGAWRCSCPFFVSRALCSHTMALQRMLEGMLSQEAETPTR